jgi:hypothetical protein
MENFRSTALVVKCVPETCQIHPMNLCQSSLVQLLPESLPLQWAPPRASSGNTSPPLVASSAHSEHWQKKPLNQQERVPDIAAEDELDVGGEHSNGVNTSSQYVAMAAL